MMLILKSLDTRYELFEQPLWMIKMAYQDDDMS